MVGRRRIEGQGTPPEQRPQSGHRERERERERPLSLKVSVRRRARFSFPRARERERAVSERQAVVALPRSAGGPPFRTHARTPHHQEEEEDEENPSARAPSKLVRVDPCGLRGWAARPRATLSERGRWGRRRERDESFRHTRDDRARDDRGSRFSTDRQIPHGYLDIYLDIRLEINDGRL